MDRPPSYTNSPINCHGVIFVTMISTITNIPENPKTKCNVMGGAGAPTLTHLNYPPNDTAPEREMP
jgi:hypothetical protein